MNLHPKTWIGLTGLAAGLLVACVHGRAADVSEVDVGFLYSRFRLTLDNGSREEMVGPFFYHERRGSVDQWALGPLVSRAADDGLAWMEFDVLYPVLSYDRFGQEYRFQLMQLLSFSGGGTTVGTNVHRFTLFPFYFQQRSEIPELNYTAWVPFYGRLKNRFWRDEARFILLPLYLQSKKRGVTTDNYLFPFFHLRHGQGVRGWQFWPLFGTETKPVRARTNHWDELEVLPGHGKTFAAWPVFFHHHTGVGTPKEATHWVILPLYARERGVNRDFDSVLWPFGFTRTVDREKKFWQWGAPWPFIIFARGEGKTVNRVWPLFSWGRTPAITRQSYVWPLYHHSHLRSAPLDRKRARVLFFLYQQVREENLETGQVKRRMDLWPVVSWRKEPGRERWRVLSLLDPILPDHKALERNYSLLWSVWRAERVPGGVGEEAASSQSLLWNFYREEQRGAVRKYSLAFGLFQYESSPTGRRFRFFHLPVGRRAVAKAPAAAGP